MSFTNVTFGQDIPSNINVIIEIPAYSDPVKYEVDKDTGVLTVDRFMGVAMQYPANYGYIPQTLADDGDPVDVLVITPQPIIGGSVIHCRPIGVLKMSDEAGQDAKILAVPVQKLTQYYNKIATYLDLPEAELDKIVHFFEHYKDLEKGKWVKVEGWFGIGEAEVEILSSIERYNRS